MNQPTSQSSAAAAPAPGAPLRVLLVDDDLFTLELMSAMLEGLGYTDIHTELDSRRALQKLHQLRPGLLICDLSMPEMDGIEFLHAAAESAYRGGVLLLSGVDSGVRKAAERLARAQGLNMLGAFKKPLASADLRAALDRLADPAPPAGAPAA